MAFFQRFLEHNLKLKNISRLRLFNEQGVEIFEEDINFLKNESVLYVSIGEEFD